MRFIFKTDYDQDIRIFKHSGYWYSYSLLLLVLAAAPFMIGTYLQSQLVFVFIYAIVGVSLLILVGFTGQASLGHAAFLAIGAYTSAYCQQHGVPFVIYFYPKDDTPGCTLEACGFRDLMARFSAKGVKVVGVSADTPESHQRFKKKYSLNFPLLSDPEKTLAKAYGVWVLKKQYGREYMGIERSTFIIDRTGHIKHAFRGVRVPGHVEAVLDSV